MFSIDNEFNELGYSFDGLPKLLMILDNYTVAS